MSHEASSSDPPPPTSYADRQLANVAAALRQQTQHPAQVGPYQILEVVGEGGMGTVYKAEQREPIARTVAVKVIRAGMDTQAVLARFESERRALAMMDHPNVARVLDAGVTDAGRSYFVMEFVDGTPITAFADEHRLSVRDRLLLMAQACAAVQHAHQKAIIHRDLKPSNVLVMRREDGTDVVKVIDFGVAKAIEQSSAERTLFTEIGQMVGTPEYMSPEQADGERDVDTRTDVYSLGVVLYELLSGALPFDSRTLRSAGYGEVCRIIREVDPPRPSARLAKLGEKSTTIADRRRSSPALLTEQLRSELDWIVVKSLRKDREGRYASPDEFAQDIENYLASRPLRAGPPSAVYRAKKFVRRNRAAVAGGGVALALLLAGIAATSWQAVRATRAERATRQEQTRTLAEKQKADDARAAADAANAATASVNAFLVDMLKSVDPERARGKPPLVRDLLDRAAADVGARLKDQPKVEAEVRAALGETYRSLSLNDEADAHLIAARDLRRKLDGEGSRAALRAELSVAKLRIAQDKLDEARALTAAVLDASRKAFGNGDELTNEAKVELAVIHDHQGDAAGAERLFKEAIAADEAAGRAGTKGYFITVGDLGSLLRLARRLDEAEPLCRRAYEGVAGLNGRDDPVAIDMSGVYADVLRLQGKLPEAEALMRDYLERATRVYGPDHSQAILPEQGLAIVLEVSGKKEEALKHFRSALDRSRNALGADHRETLVQVMAFAASRLNNGDAAEAQALFAEAADGWRRTVGVDHPNTVRSAYGVVQTLFSQQNWEAALGPAKAMFDQLADPARVQLPPSVRARYLADHGLALSRLGRRAEAVAPLTFAEAALSATPLRARGEIIAHQNVLENLAGIAEESGRAEEAATWREKLARLNATTKPATTTATTRGR